MIIYLDESKRLGKWLITVGGFISSHNTSYIEKFIANKKQDFNIPENIELKSINKFWKQFLDNIRNDNGFKELDLYSFWFCFENYFFDSEQAYTNLLIRVFSELYSINPYENKKSIIVHDNLNSNNHKFVTRKIEKYLKEKFDIKAKFEVHNSKKFLSLQLADLLVSKYKEFYFFDDVSKIDDFILYKDLIHKKI